MKLINQDILAVFVIPLLSPQALNSHDFLMMSTNFGNKNEPPNKK